MKFITVTEAIRGQQVRIQVDMIVYYAPIVNGVDAGATEAKTFIQTMAFETPTQMVRIAVEETADELDQLIKE